MADYDATLHFSGDGLPLTEPVKYLEIRPMDRAIYKYELQAISGPQRVDMPDGAELLSVQLQHDKPTLWAMVSRNAPLRARFVQMFGTGWPINADTSFRKHLGTVQQAGGFLVWHFFEVWPP